MLYTGTMSRSNRNSRKRNSSSGRKAHFEKGRESTPTSANSNGANKNTYTFGGGGQIIGVSDSMKKSLSSGRPGHEWHPSDPANGVGVHHTYMEYADGCSKCDKLESKGIHPNGSSPYDD